MEARPQGSGSPKRVNSLVMIEQEPETGLVSDWSFMPGADLIPWLLEGDGPSVRDRPTIELGVRTPTLRRAIMAQASARSTKAAAARPSAVAKKSTKAAAARPSAVAKKSTKAAAARPSAAAKKSTSAELKRAAASTADLSEAVLKSVEAGQVAALDAVRKFLDAVDEALPAIGDRPSRRATVIDAALEMADRLVTTQYDFIRSVVRSADHTLNKPGSTKK